MISVKGLIYRENWRYYTKRLDYYKNWVIDAIIQTFVAQFGIHIVNFLWTMKNFDENEELQAYGVKTMELLQ